MLPLLKKTGHPALDALLSKPFTYSRDYPNMPNYVRSIPVAASSPESMQNLIIQELGARTERKISPPSSVQCPDLYIHEFSNILLCHGLPFDDNGNLIFDSVRLLQPDGAIGKQNHSAMSLSPKYQIFSKFKKISTIPYVSGEYILSSFFTSFGHVLLDLLPSLYAVNFFPNARITAFDIKNIPDFIYNYTRPLNIGRENIFFPDTVCILEKLYIPTRAYMFFHYVTRTAIDIWKSIRNFYISQNPCQCKQNKIYLSRKYVANRKLINEDECEEIFKSFGFSIIYMENLSTQEQICTIYNATHIAGHIGSAMHNLVFCNDKKLISTLFLAPKYFADAQAYHDIERAYSRVFNVVYGSNYIRQSRYGIYHQWDMDIRNLKYALSQWLHC